MVVLFLIITTYNYNTYMSVYNMNLFGLIESDVMVIAFYYMMQTHIAGYDLLNIPAI